MHQHNIYTEVKELCKLNRIPIGNVERTLGLSIGAISKWASVSPTISKVSLVADYFSIPLDDLVKGTNSWLSRAIELTELRGVLWDNMPTSKRKIRKGILKYKYYISYGYDKCTFHFRFREDDFQIGITDEDRSVLWRHCDTSEASYLLSLITED